MAMLQTLPLERSNMLIVDDEPSILGSLQGLFRRRFNISIAESAEAALALLNRQDCFFHVVLTDQRMPGMSGCDLLRIIHQKFQYTTSVLITGYSDIDDLIQAVNQGYVFGYMTKPWNPKELKILISKAAEFCQFQLQTREKIISLEHKIEEQTKKLEVVKHSFLEFIKRITPLPLEEQQQILERLQATGLQAWDQIPDLIEEIKAK